MPASYALGPAPAAHNALTRLLCCGCPAHAKPAMKPKPQEPISAEPATTAAPPVAKPRWFQALLAWYLGWLGRIFTGKL